VLKNFVQLGELIGPNSSVPAMMLVDTSTLCVRAFVEEFDAPRVALGMLATITADGLPGQAFSGRVIRLAPYMSRKEVFTDDPTEQYDTKVREVWIELAPASPPIIGLRVDVAFQAPAIGNRSP
jgi:HlyD family secretion protein